MPRPGDNTVDDAIAAFEAWCDAGRPGSVEEFLAAHGPLRPHLEPLLAGTVLDASVEGVPEVSMDSVLQTDIRSSGSSARVDGEHPMLRRLSESDDSGEPRYKLNGEIARGGMGAILEVFDRHLRRTLAMKVILERHTAEDSGATPTVARRVLDRFLEEAQITGQLNHPAIVPLHELGVGADGRVYFTMRLVRGQHLGEVFKKVRSGTDGWNLPRAISVLQKCSEAMAYAHSKHVVHRDLKPANVMVGRFGEVYVMDWGLARLLTETEQPRPAEREGGPHQDLHASVVETDRRTDASPYLTMVGDIIGTPAYMSPEQAAGALESIGPKSDIYALGAILYELLAGRAPYETPGDTLRQDQVLSKVLLEAPASLTSLAPRTPPELIAVCEKAMARRPEDRYADTMALVEDLRAWIERRPVQAHRTGPLVELRLWVTRNKALAAAILLIIVSLAALAYIQYDAANTARAERKIAQDATRAAKDAKNRAELSRAIAVRERAIAQWRGYVGDVAAAFTNLRSGNTAEVRRRLAASPSEMRGWEHAYLSLASNLSLARTSCGADATVLAVAPDGRRLAVAAGAVIQLRSGESLQPLALLEKHRARVTDLCFLPDGRHLLSASADATALLWDLDRRLVVFELQHAGPVSAVAVDARGSRAVTVASGRHVRLWSLESGKPIGDVPIRGSVGAIAFGPAEGILAVGGQAELSLFDADARQVVRRWHVGSPVAGIAWHPRGTHIAATTAGPRAKVFVRGTAAPVHDIAFPDPARAVAWAPDGATILFGAQDRNVWLFDAKTGLPRKWFPGHLAPLRGVAVRRGDSRVFSLDALGELRAWDVATREPFTDLPHPVQSVRSLRFSSRDTRLLVVADGRLLMRDAGDGDLLWSREIEGVRAASLLGDGNVLVVDAAGRLRRLDPVKGHDLGAPVDVAVEGRVEGPGVAGEPCTHLCADPTGDVILGTVGERVVRIARAGGSKTLWSLSRAPECVAMNARGTVAVVAAGSGIDVFDLRKNSRDRYVSTAHRGVRSACFSPSGKWLAVGHADHAIEIYEVPSFRVHRTLFAHGGAVESLAFSPDGRRLASGSVDQTVILWDVPRGDVVGTLRGHGATVSALAFSHDGTRLASGEHRVGAETTAEVRMWDTQRPAARRMWAGHAQRKRAK